MQGQQQRYEEEAADFAKMSVERRCTGGETMNTFMRAPFMSPAPKAPLVGVGLRRALCQPSAAAPLHPRLGLPRCLSSGPWHEPEASRAH